MRCNNVCVSFQDINDTTMFCHTRLFFGHSRTCLVRRLSTKLNSVVFLSTQLPHFELEVTHTIAIIYINLYRKIYTKCIYRPHNSNSLRILARIMLRISSIQCVQKLLNSHISLFAHNLPRIFEFAHGTV